MSYKLRYIICFIFICIIVLSCCLSQDKNSINNSNDDSILKYYDIPYDSIKGVDPKLMSLDIYTKKSEKLKPIMIYVHGGSWRLGDKSSIGLKPNVFIENDYLFVSINYRLSPNVKFPVHAQDVAKAISWVYLNSEEYGGDKNQIYLMGHSAGAHLVSLVSTDERYLQENNLNLNIIQGVLSLDAVYDLNFFYESYRNVPDAYILTFGKGSEFLRFSSPITYVEKGKDIPPMLISYSGGGIVGSLRNRDIQSENFVDKLNNTDVYSELVPALEKSHMDLNIDFGSPDDYVTRRSFEFLEYIRINKK